MPEESDNAIACVQNNCLNLCFRRVDNIIYQEAQVQHLYADYAVVYETMTLCSMILSLSLGLSHRRLGTIKRIKKKVRSHVLANLQVNPTRSQTSSVKSTVKAGKEHDIMAGKASGEQLTCIL